MAAPAYPLSPPSSRSFFQPWPIETKEHDELGCAANQWGVGAASPRCLGPEAIVSKRGEPAGGGCGTQAWEPARCQVQLGRTDSADLHFTREFAAFPFASLLPLPFYSTFLPALRLDALNTRWDRNQVNNKSSSPLYRGKGRGAFTERYLRADALARTFIDSSQQPWEGGNRMPT